MIGAVLVVVLLLVVGGCVCVVWAERGGPGWVQAASRATLGLAEAVARAEKRRRRRERRITSSGDTGGGDDGS